MKNTQKEYGRIHRFLIYDLYSQVNIFGNVSLQIRELILNYISLLDNEYKVEIIE